MTGQGEMRSGRSWFLLLAMAGAAFVAVTLPSLPARMATHFGPSGRADAWSSRGTYLVFLAVVGLLLPLAIGALTARLGASRPQLLNVPGKEYWLAPERRREGVARLAGAMWWLACLMLALSVAVHGLILLAHRSDPPRLPTVAFIALLAGFLVGMAFWVSNLNAAMRPPG
jgi:uncharacterized membrane protein